MPVTLTEKEILGEFPWIKPWHLKKWRKRCLALGRDGKQNPRKLTTIPGRPVCYLRTEIEKIDRTPIQSHAFTDASGLWRDDVDSEEKYGFQQGTLTFWRENGFPLWDGEREFHAKQIVMRCSAKVSAEAPKPSPFGAERHGYFREIWFNLDRDLKAIKEARQANESENGQDHDDDKGYAWGSEAEKLSGLSESTLKAYSKRKKKIDLLGDRVIDARPAHHLLSYEICRGGKRSSVKRFLPGWEWSRK